jgi:Mrp family chromosome partitioning ATPase
MAEAFRDDINSVRRRATAEAIADLDRQLDQLLSQPAPDGSMNPLVPSVQARLDAIDGSTNQLQNLQLRAGVTKIAPNIVLELVQRAVGGLLLGILAALGLAALSTRLVNSADLLDKTGIEPLVEVPGAGSITRNRLREERLRTLANIVSLQDLPKSTVVALTDSRGARGARDLAEALARLSAQQGYRTVLVYADNDASQQTQGAGFNDVLADSSLVHCVLKDGAVDSLKIVPSGSVVADRYALMSRERIDAVFDELRQDADTIVVVAPSIADSIDSQPICAAADHTMLVVARRSSRAGDVTSAVDALADAHAVLLGAVLIDGTERR